MKQICVELSYENMMTQDISSVIDRRNPIFFDMSTYTLNRFVSREYNNHTSFDYVNCPVCGLFYTRPFFAVCSSYCDSIANKDAEFFRKSVTMLWDADSPDEEEWYVLEENLIRSEMRRVKTAKKLTRWEKREILLELSEELKILQYYVPKKVAA